MNISRYAALTATLAALLYASGAAAQAGATKPFKPTPGATAADRTAAGMAAATAAAATGAMPANGPQGTAMPVKGTVNHWSGAVRVLRVPGAQSGGAEKKAGREIFPDARKVHMHVHGTDPRPVEAARRGAKKWICSGGCELTLPVGSTSTHVNTPRGDAMLRSIKIQTPTHPLPLTIWTPGAEDGSTSGKLLFDPVLLGRRSYGHVRAYGPVVRPAQLGAVVPPPPRRPPRRTPLPDQAEMRLGFQWPRASELADFEYLAITDTCGNAYVQPFQRTFTVPAYHVASGGCGKADGRVLRVFPSGGWMRVTAFNLDAPAAGAVVSATFRVAIPALEDIVSVNSPKLLFPDLNVGDLTVDCGPVVLKARTGPGGMPRGRPGQVAPPGKRRKLPGQIAPPGKSRPKAPLGKTPPGKAPPGTTPPPAAKNAPGASKTGPGPRRPPIVRPARILPASKPSGQPLAHQGLVIAPEPLLRGNCRLQIKGQTKRRLIAPLALRVRLTRTDEKKSGAGVLVADALWIITPSRSTFRIPPLTLRDGFSGESRLVLEVYSDPIEPQGNVVMLSDAARVERSTRGRTVTALQLRRLIGSVTIHSAPLCGESNFETVEAVGSCFRGYFTVPAMLATLQVTRAPWVERPLITRNILSAVGVAFAVDSYDPVERAAFPIAFQVGGFVQDLGEERIGLLSYLGVAPTLPILGDGGNTTSIGLLGGLGIEYITNANGPDEGFKPAAFLSVVVQVGQANPAASAQASNQASFGNFRGGTVTGPGTTPAAGGGISGGGTIGQSGQW